MALEAATMAGPATAPERSPVEITPETTAKQLAAAAEGSGETLEKLGRYAPWLKAGPFSGRIIQALFGVPFKAEEPSEDPVETMAVIYMKLRRHWPVYPLGHVTWLIRMMREWWGGLPADSVAGDPPQEGPHPATPTGEDGDWTFPDEIDVSFTTTGARAIVSVWSDYSATIEFTDEDKDELCDIRRRYRNGELTKAGAIANVADLISERTRDCYYAGNAEEDADHWDDDGDIDRDDESIDEIQSHGEAERIVDGWA